MPATSTPYPTNQFVFFGDSLSDDGNLAAALDGLVDPTLLQAFVDAGGQVSNGPVFSEYLAGILGLDSSQNYAIAGGEADGMQALRDFALEFAGGTDFFTVPVTDPGFDFDMNLNAQIDRFTVDAGADDLSDQSAFVLIGGNDYAALATQNLDVFDLTAEFLDTLVSTVEATIAAAQRLGDLGFGEVVVSSLPAAGFFAAFNNAPAFVTGLLETAIDAHNEGLQVGVGLINGSGGDAVYLDLEVFTDAIINDPTAFGFMAPYSLTLTDATAAERAAFADDQFAFFDAIHPSAATHAMLGAYTAEALQGQVDALSGGSNMFVATSDHRLVLALGGDDDITGSGGNDLLFLGTGDDIAVGGDGDDLISGGSGNDTVQGGDGADILAGGLGDDLIEGGAGNDVLIDGIGTDTLDGGTGDDIFIFFDNALLGADTANGDQDSFDGGSGQDALVVVLAQDTVDLIVNANITEASVVLDALGITTSSIEQIEFLVGRDSLDAFSEFDWYADAELWGLL